MMLAELDHGMRCDRHIGEVFPPRCSDCSREAAERDEATASVRLAVPAGTANAMCSVHPEYPSSDRWPCARCQRDAAEGGEDS